MNVMTSLILAFTLGLGIAHLEDVYKRQGYGYIKDPAHLVPNVGLTFWSFRIMVGLGGYFILFFIIVPVSYTHLDVYKRQLL